MLIFCSPDSLLQRKRKADCHAENYHKRVDEDKLDYRAADARETHSSEDCGNAMNPLWHNIGCHMNFANPRLAAIPLGPPRQSKSHHHVPTPVGKSVGCQAPPTTPTPVKKAEEFSKEKPDISTGSNKVQNIILHDKFVY